MPTPFSNSNKFPSFFPPSSLGATDIENFCPLPSPFRKKCLLVSCYGGRGKGALREGGGGLSLGAGTDGQKKRVGRGSWQQGRFDARCDLTRDTLTRADASAAKSNAKALWRSFVCAVQHIRGGDTGRKKPFVSGMVYRLINGVCTPWRNECRRRLCK